MLGKGHPMHPAARFRNVGAIAASAALGALAVFPAQGAASEKIEVGAGGSSIVVNGTTISTSNLTLAQLAKLQGIPPVTLQTELDGVAVGTPAAGAVESLVASLPLETTVATALGEISSATGGAVSPQTALREVVEDAGGSGTAGQNGGAGASGANGANGANGAAGAAGGGGSGSSGSGSTPAKKRFTLSAGARSLKGRPGSHVRLRFNVSAAAKLSYGGHRLAQGSRTVKSGANVLTLTLPRAHGNYVLVLKALGPEGQSAQTTVAVHDTAPAKKRHH